jgi:hypothetical protein
MAHNDIVMKIANYSISSMDMFHTHRVSRVNSANVLNEGLRIGEIGRRMNSKVRLVEIGVYRK